MELLLLFSISAGQLIKLPLGTHGGATLLDVTVATLCLWGLLKLKFKLRKPPFFITSGFIFILIAILSLALTPLHLIGKEYLTSFLYIVRLSIYILLGYLVYSGAFPYLSGQLTKIFVLSGFILATLGLGQLALFPDLSFLAILGWDPHYFRTVSTFLDPNFLGAFLTLSLLILSQQKVTPATIFIFAIIYTALLTTFSRSAYLMFFVSFLTLSFLRRSAKLGILTLILSALLYLGFLAYLQIISIPRNIDREQSARYRIDSWQHGFELFDKSPILGVGYNAYRYALREYNLAPEAFIQSHGASGNDSSLLQVASTTGMIGLTAYLVFLGSLFLRGKILVAGLLGVIIHSFFTNSLFYPFILIWLILTASMKKS